MSTRNASYSLFGWDFQINAAIFIFLKNLKIIDKVRLEGKLQDIEFIKKDKTKIFAQAKAVFNEEDEANVLAKLKSALISLNEAQMKDDSCNQILYVTNSPNPFKKDKSYFEGTTTLSYDDLPSSCKEIIDTIKTGNQLNNFNNEQFAVQVIPFHGKDLDNRYKVIKEKINEFLATLRLSDRGFAPTLLNVWQNEIFKNGTLPDTKIQIKKSELIWPLIFLVTDQASDEWIAQELDEGVYEEVKNKYRVLIDNVTDRFEIYAKVVADFRDYDFQGINKEKCKSFIENRWEDYKMDIDATDKLAKEEQEYLIKIILHKILVKKADIEKIKMGAGL